MTSLRYFMKVHGRNWIQQAHPYHWVVVTSQSCLSGVVVGLPRLQKIRTRRVSRQGLGWAHFTLINFKQLTHYAVVSRAANHGVVPVVILFEHHIEPTAQPLVQFAPKHLASARMRRTRRRAALLEIGVYQKK